MMFKNLVSSIQNTVRLLKRERRFKVVQGNNRCLLQQSYETYKYAVWEKRYLIPHVSWTYMQHISLKA